MSSSLRAARQALGALTTFALLAASLALPHAVRAESPSPTLNESEKALVGSWEHRNPRNPHMDITTMDFRGDGTFTRSRREGCVPRCSEESGTFKVAMVKGQLVLTTCVEGEEHSEPLSLHRSDAGKQEFRLGNPPSSQWFGKSD